MQKQFDILFWVAFVGRFGVYGWMGGRWAREVLSKMAFWFMPHRFCCSRQRRCCKQITWANRPKIRRDFQIAAGEQGLPCRYRYSHLGTPDWWPAGVKFRSWPIYRKQWQLSWFFLFCVVGVVQQYGEPFAMLNPNYQTNYDPLSLARQLG